MANGNASFCISFGVPADPYGVTRILREIAFDSEVVWTAADEVIPREGFHLSVLSEGTLTQAADPLEIASFGADAVAYRPQILLWFENLPLASTKFQKIPYVAAVIADGSGDDVNLGEAFERLAYSPWVGYTSDQFEAVGVTDGLPSGGLIIAQDAEFLSTIQQFGDRFYPVVGHPADRQVAYCRSRCRNVDARYRARQDEIVWPDLLLSRAAPTSVSRVLELSTIDQRNWPITPSCRRRRQPAQGAGERHDIGVKTESVYLPVIMDSPTRLSLVTYAKYYDELTRKQISGTAMMYGVEIEPGDMVAFVGLVRRLH